RLNFMPAECYTRLCVASSKPGVCFVDHIQRWVSITFSFYFAQAGCALSVFLMFLLVRSGAASNIVIGTLCALFCALVIVGLGFVSSLSIGPDHPLYAMASVPAFALLYATVHFLLEQAPTPGFFIVLLVVSLAHLAIVWLGWHVFGRDLAIA
ncbi:MAG: hypothetical protein ACLFWB_13375, partial [Armatimonadota bacterium]